MNNNLKILIAQLKILRIKNNLSIRKLSKKTELAETTISRLESFHTKNPTINTLYSYADGIGFNIKMSIK